MSLMPFGFGMGMDPFDLSGFGVNVGPTSRGLGTSRSVFPSPGTSTALAPLDDRQLLDFGRLASDPLPVDVEDRENEYLVRVHQRETGMRKKDLRVDVEHGMLTIRGERESESGDVTTGHYSRKYRSVTRSMALPENIDENKIEARYEGNNLMIHIPKTGATGGRRSIQIGGMKQGAGAGAGTEQEEHKQAEHKQTEKQTDTMMHAQGQGQGQQGQAQGQATGMGMGMGQGQTQGHHAQSHGQAHRA